MPHHYMIDIETWDTAPTAAIRAIAIAVFDLDGGVHETHFIDCRRTVDEQIAAGRTFDHDTADWWRNQAPSLQDLILQAPAVANPTTSAMPETVGEMIDHVYQSFGGIFADTRIWSRGHFDVAILEDLIKSIHVPWQYHQVRDVRTLDELVPPIKPQLPHHPMSDCLAQIQQVCAALGMANADNATSNSNPTK